MKEIEIILKVISTLSANAKCKERYASELENFRNREALAKSNKYRLGVIGVTSSGKSTMINSLLGEPLLPSAARPSSSQLVSCFHSTCKSATIYFQDDKSIVYRGVSVNKTMLEKYGDEGVNSKNKERVKQIELSTPNFPFDDNIILVDSPGLDAYGYEGHEQLTMNSLLPTIDFCVFVTTCKTNSDDKVLSVLNSIAEYEKPVIIVQNMIDTIKPSLDGRKSVADVAQDHRTRVERVINRSNIKDKSKVHIVQISAINALKARQNGLRTDKDRKDFEASNYRKLVSVINTAFNQVRPVVEGHRMMFLKKEILRIAKAAIEDGSDAQGLVPKFQYEDIEKKYQALKNACFEELMQEMDSLRTTLSSIKNKSSFAESDISMIKNAVTRCEKVLCDQMSSLNNSIVTVCKKLNIDSRNIITDFRFDKPELSLKKKIKVIKNGYWKKGKRHWYTLWLIKDDDEWIDTSYTQEVTDVSASIQNAVSYINSSTRVFKQTIQRWKNSIEVTEDRLFEEIQNRHSEYEARLNKSLDAQVYLKIGKDLQRIADSVKEIQVNATKVNSTRTDVKDAPCFNIHVSKEMLPLYLLSDFMRIKIHNDIFRCITNKTSRQVVIGWDEYCGSRFLKYAYNLNLSPSEFVQGNRTLNDSILLVHKPTQPLQPLRTVNKNVFILVNATQIGAALNEISRLRISDFLNDKDTLYFVVQDFNEIINGNSVSESLGNITALKRHRDLHISNVSCKYLLLHDNPIYNLAAAEAQTMGCATQYDEIKILDDLQKRFRCLLPRDKSMRNMMETTIRIIIQKLG